jgi:hypothetical protein
MVTTLVTGLTIIVTLTLAYGDLKASDQRHELRLNTLEEAQKRNLADHDLLIKIDQNLQLLRQQVEAALPNRQGRP